MVDRIRILKLAMIAASLYPGRGEAVVTRDCKWAISDVPVYVNVSTFEARGMQAERVRQQVTNALATWNTEGQANIRAYYAGDSTTVNGSPGKINIFADDISCNLALTSYSKPTCDFVNIAVYMRKDAAGGCGSAPNNWTLDGPTPGRWQLSDVLVHELGHGLGGFSDDYASTTSVMASAYDTAKSSHLYNQDIDLLRNGYGGSFAYLARTNFFVQNSASTGATNGWGGLSVIGATNLHPGAAGNSTDVWVAYVDATNSVFPIVAKRSTNGSSWTLDSPAANSRTGVDLEATTNAVVLAYSSAADSRDLKVRRRTASWGAEISVAGASKVPPALVWVPTSSKLVLFYVDRDSHKLFSAVSSDEGNSWTTPALLATDKEYLAVDGPAGACDSSGQCLLTWPTFESYGGVTTNLCTQKFTMSGTTIQLGDRSCLATNSSEAPGIAWGSNASTGWLMIRNGRNSATNVAFAKHSTFDVSTDWASPYVSLVSGKAGHAMTFFPKAGVNHWEAFYVAP